MFLDSFVPQPLAGATLLKLWSDGAASTVPERARAILRAAFPSEIETRIDALPLGEWNAGLLRVRRLQFGDSFVLVDRCPHCEEPVELRLSADSLRPAVEAAEPGDTPRELHRDDWTIRFRVLTGADWRAATSEPAGNATDAGVRLLRRAVIEVRRAGHSLPPAEIPSALWEALAEALALADPWSEILFELRCPHCTRTWESFLEPGDYVWHEIAGVAQQSLRQVHRLASAYGWTESAILELPADRRSAYIALLDEELGWAAESFQRRFAAPAP